PVCLNNQPPCASIALRNTSSWAASATRISSASASHRRVEPSTSVNRNVTTPEGAAAVMASPRPRRYAPRSQVFSPCRGSDPDSRDRRWRRHGLPYGDVTDVASLHNALDGADVAYYLVHSLESGD